ncbi:MAG TPA: methyltransferase [Nitrospira sp.]|nr:methyltransferase [Nitrospira sp.]
MATRALSPAKIMQLGVGFWGSKALLSAIELGLFTVLARGPRDAETLRLQLGLHPRSARDFFDALVALGMLKRTGTRYANTAETALFLDRNKSTYVGGILEMANARLYRFWGSLTEGLRTGKAQNEAKTGEDFFGTLYADPRRLEGFLKAMTGLSIGTARVIAKKFPWKQYRTFVDVGCAQGGVAVEIASAHKHLTGMGMDLPVVQPIFEAYAKTRGVDSRLRFVAGDFFKEPLPQADVVIMGHILHDWNLDEKMMLLRKAHAALPPKGALIVHEALIDDARKRNAFGLLMSLNMLIETHGGFDFTGADCRKWMKEAGFSRSRVEPLSGPDSMVIGFR